MTILSSGVQALLEVISVRAINWISLYTSRPKAINWISLYTSRPKAINWISVLINVA